MPTTVNSDLIIYDDLAQTAFLEGVARIIWKSSTPLQTAQSFSTTN